MPHPAPVRLGELALAMVWGGSVSGREVLDLRSFAAAGLVLGAGSEVAKRLLVVLAGAADAESLRRIPVSTGDGGDGANCGSFGLGL